MLVGYASPKGSRVSNKVTYGVCIKEFTKIDRQGLIGLTLPRSRRILRLNTEVMTVYCKKSSHFIYPFIPSLLRLDHLDHSDRTDPSCPPIRGIIPILLIAFLDYSWHSDPLS